jgi:Ceramidase
MTFGEHVFLYCERGTNPELLAEPINALSNAAFLLAGLVGLQLALWRPREERSSDHILLPVLVLFIGLGSLAFHLYADQGTELADVVPIAVFMLVYLAFALNRLLLVPVGVTMLLVIGFTAIMGLASQVQCSDAAIGFLGDAPGAKPCLNGSVFYLPALAAMVVIGLLLRERGHKAAPWVLWAAAIFTVSVTLRSLDMALCNEAVIDGRKVGTHFAWHVLNALALFLLLKASLTVGPAADELEEEPPEVEPIDLAAAADKAAREAEAAAKDPERKTFFPT